MAKKSARERRGARENLPNLAQSQAPFPVRDLGRTRPASYSQESSDPPPRSPPRFSFRLAVAESRRWFYTHIIHLRRLPKFK